jgi:hypothetical protein
MPDPAEDVPADRPVRWGEGDFEFRALGPGVAGTGGIGAVVELADQLHRAFEGMKVARSVVADVHHPPTGRAIAVEDVEFPKSEIGIRRPLVRHPTDLPAKMRSVSWEGRTRRYPRRSGLSSTLADG